MMITFSGKTIDINNLKVEDIDDLDIGVSLSRVNRFVGHTAYQYSVLQHELLTCSLVTIGKHDCYDPSRRFHIHITEKNIRRYKLLALSHDHDEYITSDIPSPVKQLLKPAIVNVERPIMKLIYQHYQLEEPTQEELNYIKDLDIKAYDIEEQYLRKQAFVELENPFSSRNLSVMLGNQDPNLIVLIYLRKLKELGV